MKNYPLYCPKCRQERLIKVDNLKITVIKDRRLRRRADEIVERTNSPNKKNDIRVGYFVIP